MLDSGQTIGGSGYMNGTTQRYALPVAQQVDLEKDQKELRKILMKMLRLMEKQAKKHST
jgi:hypothetical protein